MNVVKVFKVTREWTCLTALLTATCCFAQSDPGPRGGAAGAGTAIGGLTPGELDFFNNHGVPQFSQVEAVADGLGPRFNLDSCGGWHIEPAPRSIPSSPVLRPWRLEILCLRSSPRADQSAKRGSSGTRTAARTAECMIFSPLLAARINRSAVPFSSRTSPGSRPTTT